jgi:hypothetical protein
MMRTNGIGEKEFALNKIKREIGLLLEQLDLAVNPSLALPADYGPAGIEVPEIALRKLIFLFLLTLAWHLITP